LEIHDSAMSAMHYAMRGLQQRADVRAHNLANVNTPGFRAERVDFETTLRAALARDAPEQAPAPITSADPNLPGPNQNTVSLEGEMVGMMKDNLLRDAVVNAYNWKAGILRSAITSR
jgi:flagellar basal-body rod protein FlgB